MSATRAALAKALAWLCTSVRVTDSGSPDCGAILHGVDGRTKKPLDVYTEITGYAVSLFQFLARTLGDASLLTMAKEAGQFLMRIQADESAYPQPSGIAGPARLYAFDTAVCVVGMARLLRATGDERYLRSAIAAGEWLLGMQHPDGSFSAMALRGEGIEDPGGFFGDGSCIHAKNAIAFLELHAITGREQFREAAARACRYTLTLQDTDGAFWDRPNSALCVHSRALLCVRGAPLCRATCWVSRRMWLPPVEESGGWRTLSGPTGLGSRTARPPGRCGERSNRFSGRGPATRRHRRRGFSA